MAFALAAYALTTPARMRSARNLSEGSFPDGVLIPKINAVSKKFASMCSRDFGFRRYTGSEFLVLPGNGSTDLFLPSRPIRSLAVVQIDGEEQTVAADPYTVAAADAAPDSIYSHPDWWPSGKLVRPSGWARRLRGYCDGTGAVNVVSSRISNVSIQGDFGWVLPQYDGVFNATCNPETAATDIDPTLEELVWDEVWDSFSRPQPGLKVEQTAGGRRREYYDAAAAAKQRLADLEGALEQFANVEAYLP